jgi:phosphoribosylaminoimidazole carboxylase (NCAIR synthetase)
VERVRGLLGPEDVVLLPGVRAPGHAGRTWCPTPRALAAIARAGARVPAAPPIEVIRRVNHRRFCADLGQTLPGACYVTSRAELDETLATRDVVWVLKRPFGFAGRGRLRVTGDRADAAAQRWIDASLAAGEGLQVEPWVERAGDFALHGYVSATGEPTLGEPTSQRCDASGAWIASERAGEGALSTRERAALTIAAAEAAEALAAAGYCGPFGVDAFRFRDAGGALHFNPRCEINARYSMGWALGMGTRRPDLEED